MTFSGIQILWGHFSQRLKLHRKPQPIKSVCWFCPQLHVGGMNKVALTGVFQESICIASCMPADSLHPSSLPIRHKAPIDDGGHQKSGKLVAWWACKQTDWHCCVSRIDCLTAGWVSITDHTPCVLFVCPLQNVEDIEENPVWPKGGGINLPKTGTCLITLPVYRDRIFQIWHTIRQKAQCPWLGNITKTAEISTDIDSLRKTNTVKLFLDILFILGLSHTLIEQAS